MKAVTSGKLIGATVFAFGLGILVSFFLPDRALTVILAILVAMIVYFFVVFLLRALTREDILLLPKGEALCRLLGKMRLLR